MRDREIEERIFTAEKYGREKVFKKRKGKLRNQKITFVSLSFLLFFYLLERGGKEGEERERRKGGRKRERERERERERDGKKLIFKSSPMLSKGFFVSRRKHALSSSNEPTKNSRF